MRRNRIAIIGAGLAGLTVARGLADHHSVTVFEKSRGFGGRMATRHAKGFSFDHGAQFFTARSRAFRDFLGPLIAARAVALWPATFVELRAEGETARRTWNESHPHYVGVPGMNGIGKYLAKGLDVRTETTIDSLSRGDDGWRLGGPTFETSERYDWVVLTAPAAQSRALAGLDQNLSRLADAARMDACYALLLGFDRPQDLPWHAARVLDADISWISINSSKPDRSPDRYSVVVHSTNAWANDNLDGDRGTLLPHLASEFERVTGIDADDAQYAELHRWRFANIARQASAPCYLNDELKIAACGDWFIRGRVESAFRSATQLLRQLDRCL